MATDIAIDPNNPPSNIPQEPIRLSKPKGKARNLPETVKIVLEDDDNMPPTGQFFGLNGRTFMIRPGEVVSVPRGIVDILDNAVYTVPIVDPQTKQVTGYRDRLRYPYRFVEKEAA
jgi:hypothetical protein